MFLVFGTDFIRIGYIDKLLCTMIIVTHNIIKINNIFFFGLEKFVVMRCILLVARIFITPTFLFIRFKHFSARAYTHMYLFTQLRFTF